MKNNVEQYLSKALKSSYGLCNSKAEIQNQYETKLK